MAPDSVVLDVKDVRQKLGGKQILDGVTFQVHDRVRPGTTTGQVTGLLGPSGVGKTRLLRLIAGLDAPDQGEILGPEGTPMPVGSVGVVFRNYILLRHRTVLGNLLAAGAANGMPRREAEEQARALLSRFGLADRADYYPAQLSGGQRQRVAIAQQLVKQKLFLVLDEPFSGLDSAALENVIELFSRFAHNHEDQTLIIITHDIRAAMMVSDTLLLFGRDHDTSGKIASGARIQEPIDLVAEWLAWREHVELDPKFVALERSVKARFARL
jgi:polar amino acid transport system ATP-binding protein/sulfate transport system ATP-binding protein